jgi:hypothetical protein
MTTTPAAVNNDDDVDDLILYEILFLYNEFYVYPRQYDAEDNY